MFKKYFLSLVSNNVCWLGKSKIQAIDEIRRVETSRKDIYVYSEKVEKWVSKIEIKLM